MLGGGGKDMSHVTFTRESEGRKYDLEQPLETQIHILLFIK